ncbi:MAG: hypothetical protein ACE5GX_05445 [Thermoanaerobaculia bacterium]
MPFPYYNRLNHEHKAIYRASDRIAGIAIPSPERLCGAARDIDEALRLESRLELNLACQELSDKLLEQLDVEPVTIKVLAARPSRDWGELQGLYESSDGVANALVTVWMRTAQKKQVVAFKTFLRTLLHELGHHLDYEYLELAESFHTEGFFKRESSLFHQIVGVGREGDESP